MGFPPATPPVSALPSTAGAIVAAAAVTAGFKRFASETSVATLSPCPPRAFSPGRAHDSDSACTALSRPTSSMARTGCRSTTNTNAPSLNRASSTTTRRLACRGARNGRFALLEAQALLRGPELTFWAMVRKTGRSWSETPVVAPMRMVLLIQTRPARGRRQSFSTPRSATQAL